MIRRIFNLLIWLCGAWAALLIFNWSSVIVVLTAPVTLVLMALPMTIVVIAYYLSGI